MLVYKATDADMSCHMGQGKFQYELGVPATAEASKCASTGLHACEYIIDCLRYYPLDTDHRYFCAEAEGDIAEDGKDTRIACTKLTLTRELDHADIAREAMKFMIRHPRRSGWEYNSRDGVKIAKDRAASDAVTGIAIARGENPRVMGGVGTYIGLLKEEAGQIVQAKLFHIMGADDVIKPGKWYTIDDMLQAFAMAAAEQEGGTHEA